MKQYKIEIICAEDFAWIGFGGYIDDEEDEK